jgi:hypothetical protein
MMPKTDYGSRIHDHVHRFFSGHAAHREDFDKGPIQSVIPGFHVIALEPGPKSEVWTYVSVGSGLIEQDGCQRLEFLITADEPSAKHTERLAMTAFYHHTEKLGLGHTFPLGEPWLPESTLDHALISLPYPFGQDLEIFCADGDHIHFYWVLPITSEETKYRHANGLEALESKFSDTEMDYTDARRASVV